MCCSGVLFVHGRYLYRLQVMMEVQSAALRPRVIRDLEGVESAPGIRLSQLGTIAL